MIAGALFVLPSLFILIALSRAYIAFGEVPVVAGLFYGIKPAVTAIVVQAAHRIGSRALKNNWLLGYRCSLLCGDLCAQYPSSLIVLGAGSYRLSAAGGMHLTSSASVVAWGIQTVLWAGVDRRRHATAGACAFRWSHLACWLE
ncbi:chromate transporter [Pseudomonas aeruginosa]